MELVVELSITTITNLKDEMNREESKLKEECDCNKSLTDQLIKMKVIDSKEL